MEAPACRVLFANQLVIDQRWVWRLSDPFWRLYFNRDPGAAITRQGRRQILPAYRAALVPACVTPKGRAAVRFAISTFTSKPLACLMRGFAAPVLIPSYCQKITCSATC